MRLRGLAGVPLLCAACSVEVLRPAIPEPCNPDLITRRSAGEEALACGHAPRGMDAGIVHACTLDAYDAGRTFHARFDLEGGAEADSDKDLRRYLVLDGQGRVLVYAYAGDPAGPGGRGSTLVYAPCIAPWVDHPPGEPALLQCSAYGESTVACAEKSEPQE